MTSLHNFVYSLFHKGKGAIILQHSNIRKIIKNLSNVDLYFRFEDFKLSLQASPGVAGFAFLQKQVLLCPKALSEHKVAALADGFCGRIIYIESCKKFNGI